MGGLTAWGARQPPLVSAGQRPQPWGRRGPAHFLGQDMGAWLGGTRNAKPQRPCWPPARWQLRAARDNGLLVPLAGGWGHERQPEGRPECYRSSPRRLQRPGALGTGKNAGGAPGPGAKTAGGTPGRGGHSPPLCPREGRRESCEPLGSCLQRPGGSCPPQTLPGDVSDPSREARTQKARVAPGAPGPQVTPRRKLKFQGAERRSQRMGTCWAWRLDLAGA